MKNSLYSEFLTVAQEAALAAGELLLARWGKVSVREKKPADLVTEADLEAQRVIADILLAKFPDHSFIGEESIGLQQLDESQCGSNSPADEPWTWIVDPLDGTTNYVHRVPLFSTSIALTKGNKIVCGVIYVPVLKEMFSAMTGCGATCNGEPIFCSDVTQATEALAVFSFSPGVTKESSEFQGFTRLLPYNQAVRRTGSTAINLAFLAAGRFDAALCATSHAWDVAAGILLIEEAGGFVSDPAGTPFDLARSGFMAAATKPLLEQLLNAYNR